MKDALARAIEREAAAVLPAYGFSDRARLSPLSESENKVFLIEDPDCPQAYVVRVNSGRLAYHHSASIASELMWMQALARDTAVPVPTVRPAGDGTLVQTLTADDLDRPRHAAVYSFLPGQEPPEGDLLPGFRRLGEISAALHGHARTWQPPAGFARHSWTPEAILDDRLNWGGWRAGVGIEGEVLALLERLEATLRQRLAGLARDRSRFGLIHADLRLANLLIEGETTAIIDFDDCGFGWYLFDLAGALSFLEERADATELIAAWLEGYRRVAPVPADMETAIPSFVLLRRLQLIGWVGYQQQHLAFARAIGADFTKDSCHLAEDYLIAS